MQQESLFSLCRRRACVPPHLFWPLSLIYEAFFLLALVAVAGTNRFFFCHCEGTAAEGFGHPDYAIAPHFNPHRLKSDGFDSVRAITLLPCFGQKVSRDMTCLLDTLHSWYIMQRSP